MDPTTTEKGKAVGFNDRKVDGDLDGFDEGGAVGLNEGSIV
jgi:hypothetical protein